MRRLFLFLFTLLIGTVATAQPGNTKDYNAYDFDTTLQGGYSISFQTDDSLQYLYLKKGRRTIAELSSMSKGLPYKNLGYIGVDCTRYFVLVHSFGFGNPHYIEMIKKVNGKNVLKNGAAWIDVDKKKQYLLYCDKGVRAKKDK